MTHGHDGLQTWILIAFIAVCGLAAFLFIPQHEIAAGAATGVVMLLVLKHVGLLAALGAPIAGFTRTWLLPRLRCRSDAK